MAEIEANGRKILVAVDEGEESMYGLSWCLKNVVCRNDNDTLVLLYAKQRHLVYSPMYSPMDQTGYLFGDDVLAAMEKYTNEVANSVMEKAKKICKEACDKMKVDTRVECGDARDVICQMAERLNVDLVVMGSHGYGLIKRTFLGSVSNHCVQNVKCPVMVVKRPKSITSN